MYFPIFDKYVFYALGAIKDDFGESPLRHQAIGVTNQSTIMYRAEKIKIMREDKDFEFWRLGHIEQILNNCVFVAVIKRIRNINNHEKGFLRVL